MQVLFGRADPSICADHGIIPLWVWDSTLLLVEPCEVSLGPVEFHKVNRVEVLPFASSTTSSNLISSADLLGVQLCLYQDCY